jgi:predicted metal-binding membrane protein
VSELVAGGQQPDQREVAAVLGAVRSRLGVVLMLIAAAGVAWWLTVGWMAGMDAGPGTALGSLGRFAGVWAVMMTAMMLPSFAPTAAVYATLTHRRDPSRWVLFTSGYLLAWSGAGVVAYGLFELGRSALGSDLAWQRGGRWLAAGVLALAALYQLTPLKAACLRRCRSPHRFLREAWGDGGSSALVIGLRNGVWCLGCSVLLMSALFALGVMSLTWMALVAAVVAFEKVGPWRRVTTAATAVVLLALMVGILAAPHDIPGLVVPGSQASMHAVNAPG